MLKKRSKSMTEAARKRIQEAFKRLNGKDATDEQIEAIYEAFKEAGLPVKED